MLIIRSARPNDSIILARLYQLVRQYAFTWERAETFKLEDYYASVAGEEVWVAEARPQPGMSIIVGFTSVWAKTSFIHNLFVLPEWQRQGIGTKLLEKALECLPPPLTLKVNIANESACRFYEKRGWRLIQTNHQAEEPYHLYHMS